MSVITLNDAFKSGSGALAGLVCLGWEEVRAYIEVGERTNIPIIMMVGPGARAFMPLEIWGSMLRQACEASSADFIIHLDHGRELEEVERALDHGFSSVMYDGSNLALDENIKNTKKMVQIARQYDASSEGEIGYVGYQDGARSEGTHRDQAQRFALETEVDCMAVSVGNVHLQTNSSAIINWDLLDQLAKIDKSLVIHGGSGVQMADRLRMARDFNVRKFNIGTEIRQTYGASLRSFLNEHPNEFDHLNISNSVHQSIVDEAVRISKSLWNLA